jgi:hypothetical protein
MGERMSIRGGRIERDLRLEVRSRRSEICAEVGFRCRPSGPLKNLG